ncbi:hypothetical protein B0H19DRAFT_1200455 [Mycena capillaripes]|nr:hypothetical protein B0H19DRAFT_1200455 [Mycena capillaripes]
MPTPRDAADITRPLIKGEDEKRSKQKDKVDEPCRLFSAGKCTRGGRCRYRHESAEGRTADSASLESPLPGGGSSKHVDGPVDAAAAPMSQKPIPQNSGGSHKSCFAWRRKGSCSKAGNCPYKHDNEFKRTLEGNRYLDDEEQRFRIGEQRREAIRRRHEQESAEYERRAVERDVDFLARVLAGKVVLSSSAKRT